MWKVALILLLAVGCAGTTGTKSYGQSSATMKSGEVITETTTTQWPDGRVETTVVETCQDCETEESKGGPGSDKLYDTMVTLFGAFLSVASIVVQVLR